MRSITPGRSKIGLSVERLRTALTSVVELPAAERGQLAPLFAGHRRDIVLIHSALEGYFGTAWADSSTHPTAARLSSRAFTMLGGEAGSMAAGAILRCAPISDVTPENDPARLRTQADRCGAGRSVDGGSRQRVLPRPGHRLLHPARWAHRERRQFDGDVRETWR